MSTNLEQHQPIPATQRNVTSPVWDMSQERAFIENLLARRFNFFLVFFSIVMAGSVNAKTQPQLQIVLAIGSAICVLFALVLARSQEKLDLCLADLFTDPSHPATIIDQRAQKGGSRRRVLGVWIPHLCCNILIVGFILSLCGVLTVPQVSPSAVRVAEPAVLGTNTAVGAPVLAADR